MECFKHREGGISIISGRDEIWDHNTSKTYKLFIGVSVPTSESERSCACVCRGYNCCLFLLCRQCGIYFLFSFHIQNELCLETLGKIS